MGDEDNNTMDGVAAVPASAALPARYELLGELGRGGMGIVYKARDRETGEIVALKVLKPEIAADESAMERFKNELRLARKITHKNVCRIHEFNRAGVTAYISMEFVEGDSLRLLLKRVEGLSVRHGLKIIRQVIAGLGEAHTQGVVHRDLKPENILIARDGTTKVMDFGVARSVEGGMTQAGALVGTPAYMSPEQAEGKPADARSDIYALGLILYEMFTGTAAVSGDTPFAVALKQIHETPKPAREIEPSVPVHIESAISQCLEKNPAKRFQSVAEFEAALAWPAESRKAGPPPEEAQVPLPLHLTRWQRSDWLLVGAAIVGLALFFPFFNRTSLAPRNQVSFDRSVLWRIAQEYAQKLGVSPKGVGTSQVWGNEYVYDYIAKTAGARTALDVMGNTVPCWLWEVHWTEAVHYFGGWTGTSLALDNHGTLQRYDGNYSSSASDETISIDDARPLAEKAIRDYFGRDPSLLLPQTAQFDASSGPATTLFNWVDAKDNHGMKRRYEVRLVGRRIRYLNTWYQVPAEYDFGYYARQISLLLVFVLPILFIGFTQRRRVQSTAAWRVIFIGALVALWQWNRWRGMSDKSAAELIMELASSAVVITFFGFCASAAVEWAVRRVDPAKFSSLTQRLIGRKASPSFGLALLRGSFLGLALLGLDSLLVWAGTTHASMWLDSFNQIIQTRTQFLNRGWTTGGVVIWAFWQAAIIGFAITFLASVFARFVRRSWLPSLVAAALAAILLPGPLINMAPVQPYHWKVVLLFLECLVLAWCYARFDVLTTFWAVFTFAFCWQNYFLLVMFEPAGNLEQWGAFALFALLAAAAAAVAFKSSLKAAYRRTAAALE